MKAIWVVLAVFLCAWPVWALSCPSPQEQAGEWMDLELVEVTVDGVPLESLEAYSGYDVQLESYVDPYEADGLTRYVIFEADHAVGDSDFHERYPVHDGLELLW